MPGGNPSMMSALMNSFSGFGSRGGGGNNYDEMRYRAELEKWLKDSETYRKAQEQAQVASAWNQYLGDVEQTQGQRLSPEMTSALSMVSRFIDNPTTAGMTSDIMKNIASTNLQNAQWGEDQKKYLLSKDPAYGQDFVQFVKDLKQPLVQINNGGPERVRWLTPDEKQAAGMNTNTPYYMDKNGEIKAPPASNERETNNAQNLTTMSNSLKRLDIFERDNPGYNPAEFGDAMLRAVASQDDSLFGKAAAGLQSQASKAYGTIAKEWVQANRAILSGAEVPETEFARDLSIYFAAPNDPPQILEMKRQMRKDRIKSVEAISTLPADQRAAAWKGMQQADELKLQGLSQKPGAVITDVLGNTQSPGTPTLEDSLANTARTLGRPLTPEEIHKATANYNRLTGGR
jgi:hypothetical protein